MWNDGNGLSADKTARLFGKFVRFNQETDTSRSAGLGLFITREIITKHGGKIWAESEVGRWINFIFTLPTKEQELGKREIAHLDAKKLATSGGTHGKDNARQLAIGRRLSGNGD